MQLSDPMLSFGSPRSSARCTSKLRPHALKAHSSKKYPITPSLKQLPDWLYPTEGRRKTSARRTRMTIARQFTGGNRSDKILPCCRRRTRSEAERVKQSHCGCTTAKLQLRCFRKMQKAGMATGLLHSQLDLFQWRWPSRPHRHSHASGTAWSHHLELLRSRRF